MDETLNGSMSDFIIEELKNGLTPKEIYDKLIQYKPLNYETFSRYTRRIKKKIGIIKNDPIVDELEPKVLKILQTKKILKINEVLKELDCTRTKFNELVKRCRSKGYEIIIDNNIIILSTTNVRESDDINCLSPYTDITFGIVSDTHFGSKSCQITALNEFAEIMRKRGVKHIFVPGDLVAGHNVYPGQIHDVYAISGEEQQETCLLNLPTGFDWYVLGGNHDYSFMSKGGGFNIISSIAKKRSDIHYVGFDEANIPILKDVEVKLFHPSGGVPYSISYRLQKSLEQITMSELQSLVRGVKDKPTVRFVLAGHLHIQMQAMFGSIWGAQCGTFEGQTNYLKRKGLIPSIGGWIVNASLGHNGLLKNFESKFYLFNEIEGDWRNYNHYLPEDKKITPIFE